MFIHKKKPEIMTLCKPCSIKLANEGTSVKALHSKTQKITCSECGRRRFGCSYEVKEGKTK